MRNNFSINFLIFILCLHCTGCFEYRIHNNNHNVKNIEHIDSSNNNFNDAILNLKLQYDTIEADFLYECYIYSYITFDAITKKGGLIYYNDTINENQYKKGYFIKDYGYQQLFDTINKKNIHYNSLSLTNFILRLEDETEKQYDEHFGIHPFCGLYYVKYHLKIETLYLGTFDQKSPIFFDCDHYKKFEQSHNWNNFQTLPLPTYIITNVFLCQEK